MLATPLAAASLHSRALALKESDPVEAEALLVRFIQATGSDKLRRAAGYDLFYLRLAQNRLVEAFQQGQSKAFQRKYREAVAMRFNLQPRVTSGLLNRLAAICAQKEISEASHGYFAQVKFGAAAFEFAVRVMQSCKVENAESVLPELAQGAKAANERQLTLKLLKIRYGIEETALAGQQLAELATLDADLLAANSTLEGQFYLLQARLAMEQGDLETAEARCKALPGKTSKSLRAACNFLLAYHLALNERFAEGYRLIQHAEIPKANIDNRLLRLTLAVGAGQAPPKKLRKFQKRASYRYSATSLKDLAERVSGAAESD
ncbi:hypothetical protein Turpa_3896 [Turneriella parva DSM 21527]|uniref:Uncharacterized protein n=1 Tax=Turneriella parva (strain ATCC BAA-1111 / DSM 21527 / NCTC 11395 / H) TaxID=869212 RepID=I4BB73_TURPD|nr:hypothetical protein Turpa_3896 [Turneriella parva DSM 21527]